jgi:cytochrome c553
MLAMNKSKILGAMAVTIAATLVFTSCKDKRSTGWQYAPNMYEHIAFEYDQKNPNFRDGKTSQLPPLGTTPIGFTRFNYPNTKDGYEQASLAVTNPLKVNNENYKEGKLLYEHMCSPCHGPNGQANGEVVQHGYPPPPSYSKGQSSRGGAMKDLTDGKIYHTITYGVNAMGSYASQLSPEERWKVVMYVHHLQTL